MQYLLERHKRQEEARQWQPPCVPVCRADSASAEDTLTALMQLLRVQQLATAWLSLPFHEVPIPKIQEVPGFEKLPIFADQVAEV